MNPHIFRAYDIRGVADTDLTDAVVTDLGRAIGTVARRQGATTFSVGRDCRLSSPRLRDALCAGLASTGLAVHDLGMVPTPLLYFSVFHRGYGGGVQITGSHNPPEFNGFKMMMGEDTLHGEDILALRARIEARDFDTGEGSVTSSPITDAYLDWVTDNIRMGPRKLRIVVDGGNGIAGPTAMRLMERLGVEAEGRYIEPDGTFPNHHPDPTVEEAIDAMQDAIRETGADLAIGFDGDGDRLGVVDGTGEVEWGDRLMVLFSRAVLREEPGATIISEVKSSRTLYDDIAKHGGNGIMWKVGHSLIKARMKETGAALAGEMSGHIFFRHRFFGFDDGLYAAARLLEIVSHDSRSLKEMLSDIPLTYATPEVRIDCPDEVKFDVVREVTNRVRSAPGVESVVDIDGVRANFIDGWGLIRASNTQPVLVMRAESTTEAGRDRIRAVLEGLVAASH